MQGLGCSSELVPSGWLRQAESRIFAWLIPLCSADRERGREGERGRGRVKQGGRGEEEGEDEGGEGKVGGEGGRRTEEKKGAGNGVEGVRTQLPNNAMVSQPKHACSRRPREKKEYSL